MKPVTVYQAVDGSQHSDEVAALARDRICKRVDVAMSPLGPRYDDQTCSYANGEGYVQHSNDVVDSVRESLCEMAEDVTGSKHAGHWSWWMRFLDGQCPPLERAMSRLYCIDQFGREWGQPYYALNPYNGKPVMLEDRTR